VCCAKKGTSAQTTGNSILRKVKKIAKIASKRPQSPIRFNTIAFIAALPAEIRVYQKLINKYEHKPTPSHPINNCKKLFDVININIKNVNKDKYDRNRGS